MGKFNFTTWVFSLVQPLVSRVLVALGLSVVSVTGFNVVLGVLKDQVISGVGGLPSEMYNLFLISGCGQALGILFGAITTRILLDQAQSSVKFMSTNRG